MALLDHYKSWAFCAQANCMLAPQLVTAPSESSKMLRYEDVASRQISTEECSSEVLKEAVDNLVLLGSGVDATSTYASLLRRCGNTKAISEGKRLHSHISQRGYAGNTFLGNLLVQMYGKCGNLEDARNAFGRICKRNAFSWNIMITVYAQNGYLQDARNLFELMPERNVVSWNTMIVAYAQNGHLQDARRMFDEMPLRDVVSWTAMITAYAQSGHGKEALEIFPLMDLEGVPLDDVTFITIFDACAILAATAKGRIIHAAMNGTGDVKVGNALVNMYGKCGSLEEAEKLFSAMHVRNVISWSSMIAAYAQNGHPGESLQTFRKMNLEGLKPDPITYVGVLDACASLGKLAEGKIIHEMIVYSGCQCNVFVGSTLINMYGKCGTVVDAKNVFDNMVERNVISWNALLAAYAQNGHVQDARSVFDSTPECNVVSWNSMIAAYFQKGQGHEAVAMFRLMDLEGIQPNEITFVSVLNACASISAQAVGKIIHAEIRDSDFHREVVVGNALVNMYGKCGNLQYAKSTFDEMPQRTVVSWNALLAAYAHCGHGAVAHFQLLMLEGLKPNEVTFTSLLFACSHAGLLHHGWDYFSNMKQDHGLVPNMEHCHCIVDLMGRAGCLLEAESLMKNMECHGDVVAWTTLIGACRLNGDELYAARNAFELGSLDEAGTYVLLSNMYSSGSSKYSYGMD